MRVALDGLPLQVRSAGIAGYTEELVRALAALHPAPALTLFGLAAWPGAAAAPSLPSNVRWRRALLYPAIMGAPLMALPRLLPLGAALRDVDLFHATNYCVPRARVPLVITVHDLALLRFPALGTPALRQMVGRVQAGAAAARRVIADSEATARDLRELLGVPGAKLRVVYPGCAAHFQPLDAAAAGAVLARHGLAPGYIMHLGTREPRKNLPRLLRAYGRLGAAAPPLVLAGGAGWGVDELPALFDTLGLRSRVRLLGPVASADLPALYSGAALFAYPSLYEGFGLPVLEAMACGTPVVTADVASLPEVAGDAALLVDPHDDVALADAIGRVLRDPALHADLRARGLARARTFTWERCAAQTMAVYEEALGA